MEVSLSLLSSFTVSLFRARANEERATAREGNKIPGLAAEERTSYRQPVDRPSTIWFLLSGGRPSFSPLRARTARRKGTIRSGAPKKRLTCGTKKERLGILSFPHDVQPIHSFRPDEREFLSYGHLRLAEKGLPERLFLRDSLVAQESIQHFPFLLLIK